LNVLARIRRRFAYAWPAIAFALALLAMNVAIDRSFLDSSNWPSILTVAMPFILVSMAAAPAIISGGVDLSIGPAAGVVNAVLIAWLAPAGWTSPIVVIAATLAIGLVIGAAKPAGQRVIVRAIAELL